MKKLILLLMIRFVRSATEKLWETLFDFEWIKTLLIFSIVNPPFIYSIYLVVAFYNQSCT